MTKAVQLHVPCDKCGSSDAKTIYEDGHGFCFSCKTYFHPHKTVEEDKYTYQFIDRRGITAETHRFYGVKAKINSEGEPISVSYIYPNGGCQVRLLDKKEFFIDKTENKPTPEGLFGRDKFAAGSFKYVTITEGADDAMSLYQVLNAPVVSVQSSSTAVRDCIYDREWLNAHERIYLAFDNDEPGREAVRSVAKLFDYNKIYVVKFTNRKDANEYLQNNEAEELKRIWWNAKKYLPDTVKSSFEDFKIILNAPVAKGIPYPFPTLNKMTYGIRTGEIVLLTAQEKVGKTSIMHHIEHKILKETEDAVAAIYLEETAQRHLQALAGLELKKPVHLPDANVTHDEIYAALQKVIRRDDRLHVYTHFGSDDPAVLLDTIRFLVSARGCRYVMFDHISMAISGLDGEDERRKLDYITTRLAMLVKELDFALIMVSHVNDDGKTRGSRYMTKASDITISATRDTLNKDPRVRNRIHLSIPYNRFCASSGPAGVLELDTDTYILTEVEDGRED